MKITCEYCGVQFDTDTAKVCPGCSAAFDDNRIIEQRADADSKLTQMEVEKERLEVERRKIEAARAHARLQMEQKNERSINMIRLGCAIPLVIICVLIMLSVGVMLCVPDKPLTTMTPESASTEPEIVDVPVTVGLNETGETSKYAITCDHFEIIDRGIFSPHKGYAFVNFHFTLQNKTDGEYRREETTDCIADGIMCDSMWDSERKTFPSFVGKGLTAEGNYCFEVPLDAEVFEIRYGNYITIRLENTLTAE